MGIALGLMKINIISMFAYVHEHITVMVMMICHGIEYLKYDVVVMIMKNFKLMNTQ